MKQKTITVFLWKDLKHPYAGGSIVYAFNQAEHWIKQGYRVIFLCPRFKGSKKYEKINGCHVFRSGGKFSNYITLPYLYLTKFKKHTDYILDVENGTPYFTPLFSNKPKAMLLLHVHKDVVFKELPFYLAWMPYFAEVYLMPIIYRNTPLVAISKSTKKGFEKLGFKSKNFTLSYCGFDQKSAKPKTKFKNPTILYLGRIEKYKRIQLLIEMFEKLNYPNSELIIAGGGRYLPEIKKRVKNSPLKNRIKILGKVSEEEKFNLYAKSWIYASASSAEGWGITVIEANACNTPAVSFNPAGLNESIQHKTNGLIANTKSEFITNMKKILDKKIKFPKLKEYASQFTWENSAKKTLEALTKQLHK